jgi:hypothetical protein
MGKAWFILFLIVGGLLLTVSCENSGPAQPTPIPLAGSPLLEVQAISYPAVTPVKTDITITAAAAMTDIVYAVHNGITYHRQAAVTFWDRCRLSVKHFRVLHLAVTVHLQDKRAGRRLRCDYLFLFTTNQIKHHRLD